MSDKTVSDFLEFIKEHKVPLDSKFNMVLDNNCVAHLLLEHKCSLSKGITDDYIEEEIDTFIFI